MNKNVLIGLSGGVDSAAAAAILKSQGYDVTAATLKFWNSGGDEDAKRIADFLSIPHITANFEEKFKSTVIKYFVDEYLGGATPNPCVLCNRELKLAALCEIADEMGIEYIATGHYANVVSEADGFYLHRGNDANKDQSYFLYNITNSQLSRLILPLGEFTKDEVRYIASDFGIHVSKKPDSQEICFLPDGNYGEFIENNTAKTPGEGYIIDENGSAVGIHKGIHRFTIGQRKGLGSFGRPVFVTGIDAEKNIVKIGGNIFSSELITKNFHTTGSAKATFPVHTQAKIRYRAPAAAAVVTPHEDGVLVSFSTPQRAVTPGQSVVFYDGDRVIGGGIINT